MANNRTERLNEEIKKTLSGIIFDMKDPRISAMTTISECSVTRDLKYCKVSVSVYDSDEQARKDTIATLNSAAGHIGWELGKRMQIRVIPKFKFVLDEGIAYSVHIADILSKLNLDGETKPDAE